MRRNDLNGGALTCLRRKPMLRSVAFVLALLLGTVVLAGCGGSSSSGLSRSQLATKVNPVCTSLVAQVKAIPVPSDFTTNPQSAAGYLDKLIAALDGAYAQIKGLSPNSAVKSQYDAYVNDLSHEISLIKDADAKAKAKDPSGLSVLNQEHTYNTTVVIPAASALGFGKCA